MNPMQLKCNDLKSELRRRDLSTVGLKQALVDRLIEADPTGEWVQEIILRRNTADDGPQIDKNDDSASHNSEISQIANNRGIYMTTAELERYQRVMGLELVREKNELSGPKLETTKRESDLQRHRSTTLSEGTHGRESINSMLELVGFFDGNGDTFEKWEKQIRFLCTTYKLDDDRAILLISNKLKGKAKSWFQTIDASSMDLDKVLDGFNKMYNHHPTRVALRKNFRLREWKQNESFSDYYRDKIILAKDVPIDEEEMIHYLIDGIPSDDLQDLAKMKGFTDKEHMLRLFENLKLNKQDTKPVDIQKDTEKNDKKYDEENGKSQLCYNRNDADHLAADCDKPKREKGSLSICAKPDDIVKKNPETKTQSTQTSAVPDNAVGEEIAGVSGEVIEDKTIFRDIEYQISHLCINSSFTLNTLLDTGSAVSFIKESLVPVQAIEPVDSSDKYYQGVNRSLLHIKGRICLNITLDNVTKKNVIVLVVPDTTMASPIILGREVLRKFGLGLGKTVDHALDKIMNVNSAKNFETPTGSLNINSEVPSTIKAKLRELYKIEYVTSSRPVAPKVDVELKLILNNPQPFYFNPRRVSYSEKQSLRNILDHLLEEEIIQPSRSEFVSPIILVKQKTGEHRLYVDYRVLNKAICRDDYPLPIIEDQIDVLRDKKFYSILILKEAFFHIRMADDSVKYTAFATSYGVYEYLKMPYGLKVGPSTFQRFVKEALKDVIRSGDIVVYMNDVLVATATLEQHLQVLRQLFKNLVDNLLELRIEKCKFFRAKVEYLGYQISENGVKDVLALAL